jgi:hypothetical protein
MHKPDRPPCGRMCQHRCELPACTAPHLTVTPHLPISERLPLPLLAADHLASPGCTSVLTTPPSPPLHNPLSPQASWEDVSDRMTELGFERGWGATAARIRQQFRVLLEILQVRGANLRMGTGPDRHACTLHASELTDMYGCPMACKTVHDRVSRSLAP